MRYILHIFILLLLITNSYAYVVKSVKYKGMVHISKNVALRMLDFKIGDDIDDKTIDRIIKLYFAQGYFDDIKATFDDGVLTFYFKEKPVISKVELKGWKEDDKDTLENIVRIKRGSLYDKRKIEAAVRRIKEAISQDGKIDSVVEVNEEKLENGSMKLTFFANEGEEIIIKSLKYSGVKGLDSDDFDDVIANKEHEFMGWLWGRNDGEMRLSDLEYDPLRIRDYYMQYGYLDAKVNLPFVRINFDDYTAKMSYQIKEGEVYTISKIEINQTLHVEDDEKIKEKIKLEVGEPFNIKTFREDAAKIKTLIADKSYAFVQVVPDLQKDKKNHTVKVIFKIIPGDKVRIRNVLISGNTRTLDRIIRRELYLGPGDMYSLTDLKDSRSALSRLGYFDSAIIEEKRIDRNTMDLIVKVKEAPTGNIQIGGGYGSYGGIMASISVEDRNIWGSGINVGVKGERSQKTQNYSFNISNSRMNDSDFSGNFSIYKNMIEYNDYDVDTEGVSFGTGYRFTRYLSGYLGYGYSANSYTLHEGVDVEYDDIYYFESYSKSSVNVVLSYDDTDDYYLPREGMTFRQSFEQAGIGADANFFKAKSKFAKYFGLMDYIDFDVIFRYKARYYYAEDTGYLPIAERFYMGGIGSVRGYQAYSISPIRTESDGTERRIGGTQTFSNNFELSFPLITKAKMRLVTYFDWGFIGEDDISEYSRGGYGAGIEWFSPVGPIQLMFSQPLNKKPGDKTSTFEFTMGQRF